MERNTERFYSLVHLVYLEGEVEEGEIMDSVLSYKVFFVFFKIGRQSFCNETFKEEKENHHLQEISCLIQNKMTLSLRVTIAPALCGPPCGEP